MPASSADLIDIASVATAKAPFVERAAQNPFYTAILIVTIMVMVTLFVFRNVDFGDYDLFRLTASTGAYSLLAVTATVFMQNSIIMKAPKPIEYSDDYVTVQPEARNNVEGDSPKTEGGDSGGGESEGGEGGGGKAESAMDITSEIEPLGIDVDFTE